MRPQRRVPSMRTAPLRVRYGPAVYGMLSRLNEGGADAPCEGDISSVVNMIVFNAMNGARASLHDLVTCDEENASLNLWRRGVDDEAACRGSSGWVNKQRLGKQAAGQWARSIHWRSDQHDSCRTGEPDPYNRPPHGCMTRFRVKRLMYSRITICSYNRTVSIQVAVCASFLLTG